VEEIPRFLANYLTIKTLQAGLKKLKIGAIDYQQLSKMQ